MLTDHADGSVTQNSVVLTDHVDGSVTQHSVTDHVDGSVTQHSVARFDHCAILLLLLLFQFNNILRIFCTHAGTQ